ncbi:putative Ig domain-containing protein [Mesorhizobium sp.]|uniref:putative Ig domain-containing protein n=1 Tax=Mesorhizobium sp. TaxID=1871066 RepID=UPI0034594CBA
MLPSVFSMDANGNILGTPDTVNASSRYALTITDGTGATPTASITFESLSRR